MMTKRFNTKKAHFDKLYRKNFSDNEIFLNTYFLLSQAQYSNRLDYFNYKSRKFVKFYSTLKNRCVITNNTRNVYSSLKISKLMFSYNLGKTNLTGFYRSIW